jgi:MerR family transcriptional regulator, light-induced transcriptional regulator
VSEQSAEADNSVQSGRAERAHLVRAYLEALRAADVAGAYKVASRTLEGGMPLAALYQRVVTPAMHELGRLWEKGAITVADEHMATAITFRVLAVLRSPELIEQSFQPRSDKPRAVLAAVQGEQHALGLRMAADLLEDAGYEISYLGADVPTEALLQAIASFSPDLLGVSATMPESESRLETVLEAVATKHPRLKLLIGGQASASPEVGEATPVDDLELLDERLRQP